LIYLVLFSFAFFYLYFDAHGTLICLAIRLGFTFAPPCGLDLNRSRGHFAFHKVPPLSGRAFAFEEARTEATEVFLFSSLRSQCSPVQGHFNFHARIIAEPAKTKKPTVGFLIRFIWEPFGICKMLHSNGLQTRKALQKWKNAKKSVF
jgi:hypothetical protein